MRHLLGALCIILVSCGGKDEKPSRDGFLTLKMNGVETKFNYYVSANDPPSEDVVHFVTILGLASEDVHDWFGLQLVSSDHIVPGTYSDAGSELHADFQNFSSTHDGGSFTLVVEEMDYYGVKGSFHGVLANQAGEMITIENGRFEAYYNYRRYE